ncbi:MAG: hypothetical protein AAFR46_09110 [Pseudomonadota bacterium]
MIRPFVWSLGVALALLAGCASPPPRAPAPDPPPDVTADPSDSADCPREGFMEPFGEEKDGGIGGTGHSDDAC